MKSTDTSFTEPAMEIVRKVDPELGKRIDAAPQPLTVVTDPIDTALSLVPVIGPDWAEEFAYDLANDFGTTVQPVYHTPIDGNIYLTEDNIKGKARELNVPVADFTADVIVHEFKHHDGYDEPEAFAEGTAFARKEHQPKLVKLSQDTLRHMEQEGELSLCGPRSGRRSAGWAR